jgi:hypothetical protein
VINLALFKATEYVVKHNFVPGGTKARRMLLVASAIKLPLLGAGFYFLVRADWVNVVALAAGLGLVQAIIGLKAIGIALVTMVNRT